VQIIGPVVDVEFTESYLPPIYEALRITSDGFDVPEPINVIAEVAAAPGRRPRARGVNAAHRRHGARDEGYRPRGDQSPFPWAKARRAAS